jgi:translation initiation factor 5B
MKLRNPIVTVVGHVDHGKTSILDSLRGSSVQESESGGITQKISFTKFSYERIKKACPLIEKSGIKLDIEGFLFIDTPGHAAFSNLRKRGGSLADLAILVIDINEGIKPQTAEVIQILKHNKTPFIIALNKLDNVSGWQSQKEKSLRENIESQPQNVKQRFDEKYMTFIGALHSHGFEADLFFNVQDFTKKIAIVPLSAKSQEGIQELIMMLCGMSQKYLTNSLKLGEKAKGVILEVKKEKSNFYAEAILYDGELKNTDQIAIASIDEKPITTKIRILEEIKNLSSKFERKDNVKASTGLRIQLTSAEAILPGMPFTVFKNESELKTIGGEFKKELSENLSSKLSPKGIIAKADSLGSLEALLTLLKQESINVVKAGIGGINKADIASGKANLDIDELDAIIVGFNVTTDEEAKELSKKESGIKIIEDEVIYKIIEDLIEFRGLKKGELEKSRLMKLAAITKLRVLPQYIFHNSNPAVFGVRVEAGKLTKNQQLINNMGGAIARVKEIQSEKRSVDEATEGMEIAISLPGTNFERQIKDKIEILYSELSEKQFKSFKENKDLLSTNEKKVLSELADIKRKKKVDWGV